MNFSEHEVSKQCHSCRKPIQVPYALQFAEKRRTDEQFEKKSETQCWECGVKRFFGLFF